MKERYTKDPKTGIPTIHLVRKKKMSDAELVDYYFDQLQSLLIDYGDKFEENSDLQYSLMHLKDSFWWFEHWWEQD